MSYPWTMRLLMRKIFWCFGDTINWSRDYIMAQHERRRMSDSWSTPWIFIHVSWGNLSYFWPCVSIKFYVTDDGKQIENLIKSFCEVIDGVADYDDIAELGFVVAACEDFNGLSCLKWPKMDVCRREIFREMLGRTPVIITLLRVQQQPALHSMM